MDDQTIQDSKKDSGSNSKIIIGVVLVIIIAIAGFILVKSNNSKNDDSMMQASQVKDSQSPSDAMQSSDSATSAAVKEFTVTGSNFSFAPSTLTVKKGDTVKITFRSSGGTHDFVIDDLNVKTKLIGSGESEVVSFIADKAGTFEYYCSVGNHRAMGMKGTLTVE